VLLQWLRAQPQLATAPAAELHVIWERLTRLSMRLAKQAVQKMGAEGRVRVAGALPPLGASFCSETPMDLLTAEPVDVSQCYLDQATVLNDEGCDIFLVETCASVAFASAAVAACRTADPAKELWVSFTLQNTEAKVWSGETLSDAANGLNAIEGGAPDAILFNCCAPEVISAGLQILRPLFGGMIGGYGNSRGQRKRYGADTASAHAATDGNKTHFEDRSEELNPTRYAQWTEDWVAIGGGAAIVGGCCGVGPPHIAAIAASVRAQQQEPKAALASTVADESTVVGSTVADESAAPVNCETAVVESTAPIAAA
jgi:S-methylmethionine-dependent homocysteine/selenocysteine methylase